MDHTVNIGNSEYAAIRDMAGGKLPASLIMNNIVAYIVGLIMAGFALLPFVNISVYAPGEFFPWIVFLAGFSAFYLLFLKVHFCIKGIALLCLVNCFFSAAPLTSFVAFIQVMACIYFYVLCFRIRNWRPAFNMLIAVLFFNAFMMIVQFMNKDVLLNFASWGEDYSLVYYGVTGQHMQAASFTTILAAAAMPGWVYVIIFPIAASLFCNSFGALIASIFGLYVIINRKISVKKTFMVLFLMLTVFMVLFITSGKLAENKSLETGRLGAWIHSLEMATQRPLTGWGIGTYKQLFPVLGGMKTIPWKTAHNAYIQILFEMGISGFFFIGGYIFYLFCNLAKLARRTIFKDHAIACLSGLSMILVNMTFAFPDRMIQCVLILIFFFAYCQKIINMANREVKNVS